MDSFKITINYDVKKNDCDIICKFADNYLLKMDKNSIEELIVFLKNFQNYMKQKEQG